MGGIFELDSEKLSRILSYYKKPEIAKAIAECAKDKEIGVIYGNSGFGKRPDVLNYPGDVIEFAKSGATSFHCSEEIWSNPLLIGTNKNKNETSELRKGWDLVIDIDCKNLEYSKIAAHLLVKAFEYHGITSISVKFSGNHGFHIAVPFEAFPQKIRGLETKNLFPESARIIASYLKEFIRKRLSEKIIEAHSPEQIQADFNKSFSEIIINNQFDPYTILELDTILISTRHLYRMPYSVNEKSCLASIPIKKEKILSFDKNDAVLENVIVSNLLFLDRLSVKPEEGNKLLIQAYDAYEKKRRKVEDDHSKKEQSFGDFSDIIPQELFPPCIKNILSKEIIDGRKRALFSLINFLTSVNWPPKEVETKILDWNKKLKDPLPENYVTGQVNYNIRQEKKIPPPNCDNPNYYKGIKMCEPDSLCQKIKNPLSYPIILLNSKKTSEKQESE